MKQRTHLRIPRGDILISLCFLAVCICVLLILTNLRFTKLMDYIAVGCYTDVAREITIQTEDESVPLSGIKDSLKTPMVLYRTGLDRETDLRGVCVKGEPDILPPIEEGRFFLEQDNFAETPTAVVGRSFRRDIFEKDGKQMITIHDIDFEVIGILGIRPDTRLDGLRLINMGAAEQLYGITGDYKIDTETKRENSRAIKEIQAGLGQNVSVQIEQKEDIKNIGTIENPITGEVTTVETDPQAYVRSGMGIYLYIIILVTFLLCTMITTVFWMQNRADEIAVERMTGLFKREILLRRLRHYLLPSLIGSIIGILVVGLFYLGGMLTILSPLDILISCISTIICGMIILICLQIYYFHTNLAQELR